MNKKMTFNSELIRDQAEKLKIMIHEIAQCCQDKKIYESNKFGLTLAQFKLISLYGEERYLTVKGIAGKLEIAKSRVTKIIEELINKNLVHSVDDPADKRVKLISLSQKGRTINIGIIDFQKEIHTHILTQLTPEERKVALSGLELFRGAMKSARDLIDTD